MKGTLAILAALMIAPALHAQEKKPWNVDRLCGRLEHVQRTPKRNDPNSFSEKRKALRDGSLSLYEYRESEPCCAGMNPVETVRTRKNGNFEFKTTKPGKFWLVTNWNVKECKLVVVYNPQKDSETKCSEQGIALDDAGNADWWLTVTVD